VLDDHRRVLRAAFEEADGYEVDTQGDAFFVAFARATDAAAAAVAGQRALLSRSWPDGAELRPASATSRSTCTARHASPRLHTGLRSWQPADEPPPAADRSRRPGPRARRSLRARANAGRAARRTHGSRRHGQDPTGAAGRRRARRRLLRRHLLRQPRTDRGSGARSRRGRPDDRSQPQRRPDDRGLSLRQGAAARPRQPGAAAACRPRHRRAARLRGRADGDRDEPGAAAHQGRARLSRSAPPRGGGGRALRRARMRRRPHLRADGRERRCGGRGLRASGRPSARGRARRRARHRSVTRSDAPPHLRAGDGRRPGRPGAAAHAAWDDRLELPAVGRERPRALRARGRLPRRVHARGSRGGLRGDVRGRRVARRQEPHFLALAERSYAERLLDDAGNRVAADL
jgi:hypothetical protein